MCPDKIPILSVSLSAIISRPESFQLWKSSKIDSVWKTQKHQLADGSIKSQLRGAPDVYPNFCCYNLFQSNAGKKPILQSRQNHVVHHPFFKRHRQTSSGLVYQTPMSYVTIKFVCPSTPNRKFYTYIISIVTLDLCWSKIKKHN